MPDQKLQSSIQILKTRFDEVKRLAGDVPAVQGKLGAETVQLMDRVLDHLIQAKQKITLAGLFIDIAGVILLALDRDGRIASINLEGARLLGYDSEDQLVGHDWFANCVPADLRESTRQVFDRLITASAKSVENYENPVLTRTGDQRQIQWHNTMWLDANGEIIGTISSGRDVTVERRALEESQARLEAVVKTAVDAIITIDERGHIETVNPATERMFGYDSRELVGKNVSMIMPAPYKKEHDGYLRRFLTTGEKRIIGIGREVLGLHKTGNTFPIDLAVSEFTVDGKRMFTGIVRDITERKKLERLVLEISAEEQQRIGRDLHDSLGQELTGIAFLTGVLQKSLAAQHHERAADAAEVVALVNQAIDHTRALVRGLCPVNLEDDGLMLALGQMAETVKDLHGVRCEFHCPSPVLIHEHNTATHLYYITNEAVTNALRHGKPKRIIITLKANEGRGTLTIADDGTGIKTDTKPRRGRGIQIMHYRARMIAGTCDILSKQDRETIVTCTFQLTPQDKGRNSHERTQSPAPIRAAD